MSLSIDLARQEVLQILLAGFLPITAPDEMHKAGRQTGLRELGLPYAVDPAFTKHLAAFLTQAQLRTYHATLNLLQSLSFGFGYPCEYKEKTCHTNSSVDPESSGRAQPLVQNGKRESQKKRSQPESRH